MACSERLNPRVLNALDSANDLICDASVYLHDLANVHVVDRVVRHGIKSERSPWRIELHCRHGLYHAILRTDIALHSLQRLSDNPSGDESVFRIDRGEFVEPRAVRCHKAAVLGEI